MDTPEPDSGWTARLGRTPARSAVAGSAVVAAHVVGAVYLSEYAHDVAAGIQSRDEVFFPHVHPVTLLGWGLIGLAAWFMARFLRSLGAPSPGALAAVLPLLCLVLLLPISMAWRTMSATSVPDVEQTVNLLALSAGSAVLAFLAIRGNLSGKRLAVRVPLAAAAGGAVALALAFGTVVAELWRADREAAAVLADAPPGVISSDAWPITGATMGMATMRMEEDRPRVDLTADATGSISVAGVPAGERDRVTACDCDRRGNALVPRGEGAAPSVAYAEAEGHVFEVRPYYAEPRIEILELTGQIRPATAGEQALIRRHLVEDKMKERRITPPYSILD